MCVEKIKVPMRNRTLWISRLFFYFPRSRRKKQFPSFTTELKLYETLYYHLFVTLTLRICGMFSSSKCFSALFFFVFFFQPGTRCQTWTWLLWYFLSVKIGLQVHHWLICRAASISNASSISLSFNQHTSYKKCNCRWIQSEGWDITPLLRLIYEIVKENVFRNIPL